MSGVLDTLVSSIALRNAGHGRTRKHPSLSGSVCLLRYPSSMQHLAKGHCDIPCCRIEILQGDVGIAKRKSTAMVRIQINVMVGIRRQNMPQHVKQSKLDLQQQELGCFLLEAQYVLGIAASCCVWWAMPTVESEDVCCCCA